MKIPTFVLVYFNSDIIQKSLNSLIKNETLDIHVVENKSDTTPQNQEYLLTLLKEGNIASYMLMDENISNNAFEIVLRDHVDLIASHAHVIVTDGDLEVYDDGWLEEQLSILKEHPSLFLCAMPLMTDNLPLKARPESINWTPPILSEGNNYLEQLTGIYLCLFNSTEFISCLNYLKNSGLSFLDSHMHHYCYELLHKKWAVCKNTKAKHLTWDVYADKNHLYNKEKDSKSLNYIWTHTRFCSYTKYTYREGAIQKTLVRKNPKIERISRHYNRFQSNSWNEIFNIILRKRLTRYYNRFTTSSWNEIFNIISKKIKNLLKN